MVTETLNGVTSTSTEGEEPAKTFTDDEAALYDRQIRLWGVDAQKRLNNSKILIIGMGGIGAEVAKNIILGGVKSVKLMDDSAVSELDASAQFLVSRDAVGQNRAEASLQRAKLLNPMVEVSAESGKVEDKPDEFFTQFTVICVSNCSKSQACRINRIARQNGVSFFASDIFGFVSFIFADLGEHHYQKELTPHGRGKVNLSPPTVLSKVAHFVPYQDILNIDWNLEDFAARVKKTQPGIFAIFVLLEFVERHNRKPHPDTRDADLKEILSIRDEYVEKNGLSKEKVDDSLFENVCGELGPVCAITGGQLAQEVVKAVSRKDDPLVNFFVFNPVAGTAHVENFV
ncbi:unnamed protein product [Orchesella dallaii]|uniref:SUMO-activating enzyme subunit 1 n=1 Tax=Orchesella dallaii TaxID=48710 RepID=A0ABP1QAR8_9HEXA